MISFLTTLLHDCGEQRIVAEMWAPAAWVKYKLHGKNKEVLEASKEDGSSTTAKKDEGFMNLGLWCSNGHVYNWHMYYYCWGEAFNHWARMPSYLFRYKQVDVQLQIAMQLH